MTEDDVFPAPPDAFALEPVHPGEVLDEELAARGLTANALALKLRVPANRLTEILNGKRGISPDTALRLSRISGRAPRSGSACRASTIWRGPRSCTGRNSGGGESPA